MSVRFLRRATTGGRGSKTRSAAVGLAALGVALGSSALLAPTAEADSAVRTCNGSDHVTGATYDFAGASTGEVETYVSSTDNCGQLGVRGKYPYGIGSVYTAWTYDCCTGAYVHQTGRNFTGGQHSYHNGSSTVYTFTTIAGNPI